MIKRVINECFLKLKVVLNKVYFLVQKWTFSSVCHPFFYLKEIKNYNGFYILPSKKFVLKWYQNLNIDFNDLIIVFSCISKNHNLCLWYCSFLIKNNQILVMNKKDIEDINYRTQQ